MNRLSWENVRQSFWFLPTVLCAMAGGLAEVLILVDDQVEGLDQGPLGFLINSVGAAGSRDLLLAIAGSTLAVASTTFSITIAVLAVASSTYGPRLVRNFMADRGNQFVLGVLVATFLYSLLVLRSIRVVGDGDDYFVPHLAVNVAVLLAVLAIGVLVYFIHHIADSVQIWTLTQRVRTDLFGAIDRLYPERVGRDTLDVEDVEDVEDAAHTDQEPDLLVGGHRVSALDTGYVESIDVDGLLAAACRHDLVVAMAVRPGDHVIEGTPLAVIHQRKGDGDYHGDRVRAAVRVGQARTPHDDVEFSVRLLEEMAVRALSPNTNDPYTAVNALDDLSSALVRLAGRRRPSRHRYDDGGQLRVIARQIELTDLIDRVVDAMRTYAIDHPMVLHRTLTLIELIGSATPERYVQARLDLHVERLIEAYARTSPQACDAEELNRHAERVRRALADASTDDQDAGPSHTGLGGA